MHDWQIGSVSGIVLLLLLFSSSMTDLSRRKIFNWTTYCAFFWAIGINIVHEIGFDLQLGAIGLKQSLCGFVGCLIVMLFVYWLARGGAGDVKLAAAIGALIGFEQGLLAIAVSYVIAGASVLLWSVWQRGPWNLLTAVGRLIGSMLLPGWVQHPDQPDKILLNKQVPLAQFFALGNTGCRGRTRVMRRQREKMIRTSRRTGFSSLEVVMTTAIALPLAGLLFFLGIQMCRYAYSALSGLLLQPFV